MAKPAKRTPAKGGRPARRDGERLNKNRTFRVRGSLDDRLIEAAEAGGRSVSEEIEQRLEQSFSRQDMLQEALSLVFGDAIGGLLRKRGDATKLRDLLRRIGRDAEGMFDYETYIAVNTALGYNTRSREEWENLPPPPTPEEFEAMKARHASMIGPKGGKE